MMISCYILGRKGRRLSSLVGRVAYPKSRVLNTTSLEGSEHLNTGFEQRYPSVPNGGASTSQKGGAPSSSTSLTPRITLIDQTSNIPTASARDDLPSASESKQLMPEYGLSRKFELRTIPIPQPKHRPVIISQITERDFQANDSSSRSWPNSVDQKPNGQVVFSLQSRKRNKKRYAMRQDDETRFKTYLSVYTQ